MATWGFWVGQIIAIHFVLTFFLPTSAPLYTE